MTQKVKVLDTKPDSPVFDPQDPHGGKRTIPTSLYSNSHLCALGSMCPVTYTKIKQKSDQLNT